MQKWNDQRAIRETALQMTALEMKMSAGEVATVLRTLRETYEALVEQHERKARKQAKQAKAAGNR